MPEAAGFSATTEGCNADLGPFLVDNRIEYSVTVDRGIVHLYVMDTDQEIVFADADELMAWLRSNRAEAAQEPVARPIGKARRRRFMDWS